MQDMPSEHSLGVSPFVPNGGEDVQEDAVDYLSKILEICF
jgi:hypothetical protein